MNWTRQISTTLAVSVLCLATKPAPFTLQYALLDRIAAVAASQSTTSPAALGVLRQVALGREFTIPAELEVEVAVRPGELQPVFKQPEVRVHSLRNIGRLASSDAIDFLTKLTPADLGPDDSQRIWPAAQIALQEALLNQIPDAHRKGEFLETTVKDPPGDRMSQGRVKLWAITELCDGGFGRSLPAIKDALRGLYSTTAEEEVQFCQNRIEVLQRNPDRVKALSSVLRVDQWHSKRLTSWAMYKLDAMQSPEADAELDRFAAEIAELPEGSPAKQRMVGYANQIRSLQSQRALRPPRPRGRPNP